MCFLLQQYYENRLKTLESLKATGDPYPHKFPVGISVAEYIEKYKALSNGEKLTDVAECLAGNSLFSFGCILNLEIHIGLICIFFIKGRIMNKRTSSSKLFFYDLYGGGMKVQVMADAR